MGPSVVGQPVSLEKRLQVRLDDLRKAIEWRPRGDDPERLLELAEEMVALMK